jgi:hypothetical protein
VLLAMAGEEDASAFVRKREALAYLKKMRSTGANTFKV